jgi:hypothetical protein
MVSLLRDLAVDPHEAPGPDNPLRQVITNTHSPRFVKFQDENDMLLAIPRTIRSDGHVRESVAFLPLWNTWRQLQDGEAVSKGLIGDYLTEPADTPLRLDFPGRTLEGIA